MARDMFMLTNKLNTSGSSYNTVVPSMVKAAKKICDTSLDYVLDNPSRNYVELPNPRLVKFKFGRDYYQYPMMRYSAHQLCQKVGVPPVFFERLLKSRNEEVKGLITNSMNTLLKHHSGPLLFRTAQGCLRGVLTPRYRAFDTDRILDVFTDCFGNGRPMGSDNIVFRGSCVALDMFHMRFTTAEPVKGIADKDLYYGMSITSSDVGKYSLSVKFFVYKQVCTNGLCLSVLNKKLYSHRHIGITADSFREGLLRSFEAFPELVVSATDIIKQADSMDLSETPVFDDTISNVAERAQFRQVVQKYLGVSEETMLILAQIAKQRYGTTLWGYVNAITEWAQMHDLERREELESKAGTLMTDFNKFVKAAA